MTPQTPQAPNEYDRWSNVFESAWHDPGSLDQLDCPSCGKRSIALKYLADLDASVGMFAFWCMSCLRGFPPGYGPIPEGAVVLSMDRRGEIPNYDTVVEGGE